MKLGTALNEELFWLILREENGVVIPLMAELGEPFRGVYGSFKLSVEKLIPIINLLPWKITEPVVFDVVQSYEWLISSETTSWFARVYVDKSVV